MLDPIGAFNRIRDFYISYLETAFSIRNRQVSGRAAESLLESGGSLCTDPIVEPLTRYKTTDFTIADLIGDHEHDKRVPGLNAKQREAFVHLALSGLFDAVPACNPQDPPRPKYPPYTHQVDMLRRGIANGTPSGRHFGHRIRKDRILSVTGVRNAGERGPWVASARSRIFVAKVVAGRLRPSRR